MKLKTILMITGSYTPMSCGVGDYTSNLVEALLSNSDLNIQIITSKGASLKHKNSNKLSFFPMIKNWSFFELPKIVCKAIKLKPDIVHIQYPTRGYGNAWAPYFLPFVFSLFNLKIVQTWHEPPTRFRFFPNSVTRDFLIGVEPDFICAIRKRYRYFVSRKKSIFIQIGSNIKSVQMDEVERNKIRELYVKNNKKLIAYFGYLYPSKNVESLFEIADPIRDNLVLITELNLDDPYHNTIYKLMSNSEWSGNCSVTGYLPPEDVAKILKVADAAIFPFKEGVGMRNGSFLAAKAQGSFTITTSKKLVDYYDPESNVFYARPGDIIKMKTVLTDHFIRDNTKKNNEKIVLNEWEDVAIKHVKLYSEIFEQHK